MLEPDSRQLLGEALRPPAGFHFDRAIGTTFSLNLMALLTMPVAFTMFDRPKRDGRVEPDPLALLQAIRRFAGRMHLFCQAGQIAVPKRHHLLFANLEDSIIEVTPPNEHGVFHPKITVLRFVGDMSALPEDHPDHEAYEPVVRYRLLCSSRNLTFDRSWDTMLVLEGELASHRQRAFHRNRPLGQFIDSLPELAIRSITPAVRDNCRQVADELRRVDFELPEGFDDLAFWPLGLEDNTDWPFIAEMDRVLVVSPFVSDDLLCWLETRMERRILVSRPESLDELRADTVDSFETYLLHPAAEEPTQQADANEEAVTPNEPASDKHDQPTDDEHDVFEELTGLHAKLFVADRGRKTHLWTGSANATDAAFSHNIEFLVELQGPRRLFGVNKLVRRDDERDDTTTAALHFDDLLDAYQRPSEPVKVDHDAREAERLADRARRTIAAADFAIYVEPWDTEHLNSEHQDQFRLVIRRRFRANKAPWDKRISVNCRPVTLPTHAAVRLPRQPTEADATFGPVSFKAITAFVAFDVVARAGRARHTATFVLNLPLHDAPADRDQRLLTALLENREQLLRYLLMLLAEDEHDLRAMTESLEPIGGNPIETNETDSELDLPLLEPLLKALEHQPERLDQIARLVDDLSRHEQGRTLLPEGFAQMWQPIWAARQEVTQ